MNVLERINGFDALRTVAMWLGIVLHAIIVYKVIPEPNWPHDPGLNCNVLDWLYGYIHDFRMPLFFLVAGYFARMVIVRSGIRHFCIQRFRRIVIPFLIGVIVIVPISLLPFSYYQFHFVQQLSTSDAWKQSIAQLTKWSGLAHLWFLYYLVIFYAFSLAFVYIARKVKLDIGARLSRYVERITLLKLLFAVVFLALIFFVNQTAEPIVYTGVKPNLTYILHYGFFYVCGWILQMNKNSVNSLTTYAWMLLIAGTTLSLLFYYQHPLFIPLKNAVYIIKSLEVICLIAGFTGLFVKYFHAASKTWRYFSDAAYWVYLIHLCIVAGFQVLLINSPVPLPLRLPIVLVMAFSLSLLSYHWLVRYSIIGEFLHGKRTRPAREI